MQIGVIADTHSKMRPEALEALKGSEVILHAGDVGRDDVLIESVSTIRDGAIVRMIGDTPERVAERLNRRLEFTRATLGSTPWERKW